MSVMQLLSYFPYSFHPIVLSVILSFSNLPLRFLYPFPYLYVSSCFPFRFFSPVFILQLSHVTFHPLPLRVLMLSMTELRRATWSYYNPTTLLNRACRKIRQFTNPRTRNRKFVLPFFVCVFVKRIFNYRRWAVPNCAQVRAFTFRYDSGWITYLNPSNFQTKNSLAW